VYGRRSQRSSGLSARTAAAEEQARQHGSAQRQHEGADHGSEIVTAMGRKSCPRVLNFSIGEQIN